MLLFRWRPIRQLCPSTDYIYYYNLPLSQDHSHVKKWFVRLSEELLFSRVSSSPNRTFWPGWRWTSRPSTTTTNSSGPSASLSSRSLKSLESIHAKWKPELLFYLIFFLKFDYSPWPTLNKLGVKAYYLLRGSSYLAACQLPPVYHLPYVHCLVILERELAIEPFSNAS